MKHKTRNKKKNTRFDCSQQVFAKIQMLLFISCSLQRATNQIEYFSVKQDVPALDGTFSSQNEQISIKNMCFY